MTPSPQSIPATHWYDIIIIIIIIFVIIVIFVIIIIFSIDIIIIIIITLQALSLSCPSATKISIQLVQYGDTQQCPPSLRYPGPATTEGKHTGEEQVAADIE